jgi:ferritin
MAISDTMNSKLNDQVTNELTASQIYLSMACMFDHMGLKNLCGLFLKQTDEERGHAMKIMRYTQEAGGRVRLKEIPAPPAEWPSVAAAVEEALNHERKVTGQINDLVALADKERDYATRSFLNWFVDEQVEEEDSMGSLLQAAEMAGKNLLQLEAYVAHMASKD